MNISYAPYNTDTEKPGWNSGVVFVKYYFSDEEVKRAEIMDDTWAPIVDGAYRWEKYETLESIKANPERFIERVRADESLQEDIRYELLHLGNCAMFAP
jgi:hypothetical protein